MDVPIDKSNFIRYLRSGKVKITKNVLSDLTEDAKAIFSQSKFRSVTMDVRVKRHEYGDDLRSLLRKIVNFLGKKHVNNLTFKVVPFDLLISMLEIFHARHITWDIELFTTTDSCDQKMLLKIAQSLAANSNLTILDFHTTFTMPQLSVIFHALETSNVKSISFIMHDRGRILPDEPFTTLKQMNLQILSVKFEIRNGLKYVQDIVECVIRAGNSAMIKIGLDYRADDGDLRFIRDAICNTNFAGRFHLEYASRRTFEGIEVLDDLILKSKAKRLVFEKIYTSGQALRILELAASAGRVNKALMFSFFERRITYEAWRLTKLLERGSFRYLTFGGCPPEDSLPLILKAFENNLRITHFNMMVASSFRVESHKLQLDSRNRTGRLRDCLETSFVMLCLRYHRNSELSRLPKDIVKLLVKSLLSTFWETCWPGKILLSKREAQELDAAMAEKGWIQRDDED